MTKIIIKVESYEVGVISSHHETDGNSMELALLYFFAQKEMSLIWNTINKHLKDAITDSEHLYKRIPQKESDQKAKQ